MPEQLGNVIKSIRRSKSIKARDFSKHLVISPAYLSAIENNERHPSPKLLKAICMYLDVSVSEVIASCLDFQIDEKAVQNVLTVLKYGTQTRLNW